MWFRYFITFLDILLLLIILSLVKIKNKYDYVGFGAMLLSYVGSVFLMWR